MKKLITAIVLSIAIPAAAYAQASPSPEPAKADCCEKMKAEGKDCCKDMHGKMDAKDGHSTTPAQPKAEQQHQH